MDIKSLLIEAGYAEEAVGQTKFVKPPASDYAVWHDEQSTAGGDDYVRLIQHKYTIELYSRTRKRGLEAKVDRLLLFGNIEFKKPETVWLEDEQIYLTQYQFTTLEKVR